MSSLMILASAVETSRVQDVPGSIQIPVSLETTLETAETFVLVRNVLFVSRRTLRTSDT